MRSLSKMTAGTIAAAAALALAGCGDRSEPGEKEAARNVMESDTMYEPGNDVSAMEAASNEISADPVSTGGNEANGAAPAAADGPLGETSGGDTGGNTSEDDVSGM